VAISYLGCLLDRMNRDTDIWRDIFNTCAIPSAGVVEAWGPGAGFSVQPEEQARRIQRKMSAL
jgi:hypothetical protein